MEQMVADTCHTNAFAGIAECLAAADEQYVIVSIVGYTGLIGRLERSTQVLAEVHGKVGKVFHDDDIIFIGKVANDTQFVVSHTYPCGIVGIAVYDSADVTVREIAFQLVSQFLAAVVVDIEGLILYSLYL